MMAYFDVKDPAKATLKSVKGMFPVDMDSKINKKGAVNGVAFKLPWDKAYEFNITSAGRTYQLFAETQKELQNWTKASIALVDFLNAKKDTGSVFTDKKRRRKSRSVMGTIKSN